MTSYFRFFPRAPLSVVSASAALIATLAACLLGFPTTANAAPDDYEDEFPPGLLATYTAGDTSISRIDPDINFDWGTASPDPRIPAGPFTARWSALMLFREASTFRFHAYVQGKVTVRIDDDVVLEGSRDEAGWISGQPTELRFGEKDFEVTYHRETGPAMVRLFWSSDAFRLEPLPAHLFFRDGGNPELDQIEQGRIAFAAHRCNRCHQRDNDPAAPPAPALETLRTGTDYSWLVRKLTEPADSPHARMPDFGLKPEEAALIAGYLQHHSGAVKLLKPGKPKDAKKDLQAGRTLFRSLGCLACHQTGEEGTTGAFTGGDLSGVGGKRSHAWVLTWLSQPGRLNRDHRMPVFSLSGTERGQLALYLSQLKGEEADSPQKTAAAENASTTQLNQQQLAEAKTLITAANCAACHRIPGIETASAKLTDLSTLPADFAENSGSCLNPSPDRSRWRPAYRKLDREAVQAFLESRTGELAAESLFARGERVLEERNCLACHERGTAKGIREIAGAVSQQQGPLHGQSEGLIPPSLTSIGDKLLNPALAEAVSGEQKQRRLHWLHVQMPRFNHSDQDKAGLLHYLIRHDRIPDDAPRDALANATATLADSQQLVAGHTLVGASGFSCIACHQVGSYQPKNVALGTRGSDLLGLGKRMRQEWYLRWTRSPMRIVPGMEMPSYKKALPGLLDEQIDAQLLATWNALNDPRFTPPTNPTSVEQFWIVQSGQPARIVRDVFTDPDPKRKGAVARSLAIGLNNGHNILLDLDSFALRGWTFGEFARQRTQGKSWYWDLAGVPVMDGLPASSDFAMQLGGPDTVPIPLLIEHGLNGKLRNYRNEGDGVIFNYVLWYPHGDEKRQLEITETIGPLSAEAAKGRTGWERLIRVKGLPEGAALLWQRPSSRTAVGEPTIVQANEDQQAWVRLVAAGEEVAAEYLRIAPEGSGDSGEATATLRHTADLHKPSLELKTKPQPPPVAEAVHTVPGYTGVRLPLNRAIMPTAMTWSTRGLAFTSLKGDVFIARDADGDGIQETLELFEEGLAAPFGVIADGEDLIIAHKPEVIRLRDTDGDGRCDQRTVIATGWGYNDNYHDWTCGIVRDSSGNLYVGLGSDYAQRDRPKANARWRGTVLRISPEGEVSPVGHDFRYPTGLAINGRDQIFVSDNQGVQNTFNEINFLVEGKHYGVPSRYGHKTEKSPLPPAIQVPHPWTRSVNGLFMLPESGAEGAGSDTAVSARPQPFAGHGIGCEYDNRLLIRFSTEMVDGVMQGAAYYFSRPNAGAGGENFVGPLGGMVAPNGDIYIGSIFDSGWLGGTNTGAITRLRPTGKRGNGIREVRATPEGFRIEFLQPVDRSAAAKVENYSISGYTRVWKGGYGTPDSGRHKAEVTGAEVSQEGTVVTLQVDGRRTGNVYEITCGEIAADPKSGIWPTTAHYTLHRIPGNAPAAAAE